MFLVGKIEIPDSEITFEFARSSGPGGQNVNKVETKVTVRFTPRGSSALTVQQVIRIEERLASRLTKNGELLVSSEQTRHREQNREDALQRLARILLDALKIQKKRRLPARPGPRRSAGSKGRSVARAPRGTAGRRSRSSLFTGYQVDSGCLSKSPSEGRALSRPHSSPRLPREFRLCRKFVRWPTRQEAPTARRPQRG